jgi:2-methylthioadenine synthetase
VAGCLVERYRGDIQKNMPEVDAVIGTNELEKITALCEGVEPAERNPFEPYLYHDATPRVLATPSITLISRSPKAAIIHARSA